MKIAGLTANGLRKHRHKRSSGVCLPDTWSRTGVLAVRIWCKVTALAVMHRMYEVQREGHALIRPRMH